MAGETVISTGNIEKRAEELETKVATEKADAEKAETDRVAAEQKAKDDAAAAEAAKPKPGEPAKKEPNDPKELRAWATRQSMELADVKRQMAELVAAFNKTAKKPIDLKELVKDPAKLEKAIAEREKELVDEHVKKYNDDMTRATADVTNLEDKLRYHDTENYPLWADLKPLMLTLSKPTQEQPNGDPRINFNQHPKLVLDDLYALAKEIAEKDPNFKKPAAAPAAGADKTYTQAELDAKIAEAQQKAKDEAAALRAEGKGAGVGSMGKGSSKGKPGEVDKAALWDMPLNDLGAAVKKATEALHG